MSATINKNVSEANSRQDPTGLIGHDICTPHNRSLLIPTDFQIIQTLQIGSPLAKLCQNLPLGAQLAVPTAIYELISQNTIERHAIALRQCFQPILFKAKNWLFIHRLRS